MPRLEINTGVMVPMRDGVRLATDLYLPDQLPAPVLLTRTPYDKDRVASFSDDLDLFRALRAGYAVVVQDVRGRFASEGVFEPFRNEADDGADTIAWIAGQDWCDGAVGMFGKSYLGATQWQAVVAAPSALRAIAASMTPAGVYEGNSHHGGVPTLHPLLWAAGLSAGEFRRQYPGDAPVPAEWQPDLDGSTAVGHLPLADHPAYTALAPFWADWLAHPDDGPYWQSMSPSSRYDQVQAPALNIAGWYDILLGPVLTNYAGVRDRAATADARRPRLVIGPWSHINLSGVFPERDFGPSAGRVPFDLDGRQLAWFDHWLRGVDSGADTEPAVTYFLMGADQWRTSTDWPPPEATATPFYLHSDGHANTHHGDGILSTEAPVGEQADTFSYDPLDPVPTVGGQMLFDVPYGPGPRDQAAVEDRPDVLVYTSEPLTDPLVVAGPVRLIVHVTSTAPDTDISAKLVDVFPDGRAMLLTDGILRARYRNTTRAAELMAPGPAYELAIDLWATANEFRPGHRVRLEVSGGNFPKYGRNSNTGGDISNEPASAFRPAINRVLHDPEHPSRLILPVVEHTKE